MTSGKQHGGKCEKIIFVPSSASTGDGGAQSAGTEASENKQKSAGQGDAGNSAGQPMELSQGGTAPTPDGGTADVGAPPPPSDDVSIVPPTTSAEQGSSLPGMNPPGNQTSS